MISQSTLTTLEFAKVRERVAPLTSFSASRELALALTPINDAYEVRRRLRRTSEARWLLEERPETTIGGARDIRPAARHAQRGGVLDAQVLLEVAATLASSRRLRTSLLKLDPAKVGLLQETAELLIDLPQLEGVITGAIGDDGTVLDSASPKLASLRAEIRIAFQRLQERLQSIVNAAHQNGALQEAIITVRNGRYVVPVKATHRRMVRGLVHDQSSSGATLYVEPLVIVELNNRWRELQSAEEGEVVRILSEISDRVGADATAIVCGVDALAELDLAFALAKYAIALRAIEPEIYTTEAAAQPTDDPTDRHTAPLLLTRARHPLLNQETVVPTDIWLGGSFRLLLITGPNTGGKTVALKTTGLLALMAQAGMHIPAAHPSRLPIFGQIFADIGDEQSIEQSLSTFSSHMTNIIRILRALDEPDAAALGMSLVLLDELGAGTDPVEGAALARAIIERLLDRGTYGIATTHYAELKAFAYSTPGVENGSVEFDVDTLRPTYRLTIGIPGRSNALAIASRLGLDSTLVERARSTMTREEAQVEDLLAGIHRERSATSQELQRAEQLRADAEKYRDRLAEEWHRFEQQREQEWQSARDEIESELRESRAQLRRLRDDFRSVSLTRQWLEEAEKRVQQIKEKTPEQLPTKRREPTIVPPPTMPVETPRPFQVGETVIVRSVGLSGDILSIDESEQTAEVQVGGFRMEAPLRELRRASKTEPQTAAKTSARYSQSSRPSLPPAPSVSMNFDLRGWRAAEVPQVLDRYLNDAYLADMPFIRVIHGKGTGALRHVVRDTAHGHPLVSRLEGGGADGGEGVTVIHLVSR